MKAKESRAVKEAVKFLLTTRSWSKKEMAVRGIIYQYANGQFQLAPIGKIAFKVIEEEANK